MNNSAPTPSEAFRDLAHSGLQDARFAVAYYTADALGKTAVLAREVAKSARDKALLGVSIVMAMASETGIGALNLYNQQLWYAGAALTRQLVEHHHLCEYFAQDIARAAAWLDAGESELKRDFAPRQLRDAGGFTNADYATHCRWGGHPNPSGSWLVIEGVPGPRREFLLIDIAQHLQFIYSAVVRCIGEDIASQIPAMLEAFNLIVKWRVVDPYASGLPVGPQAQDGQVLPTDT